ncbi:MAG: TonB-dependent receptor [Granulosicoccus sp.]
MRILSGFASVFTDGHRHIASACPVFVRICSAPVLRILLICLAGNATVAATAADSLETIEVVAEQLPATGEVVHEEFTGSHVRIDAERLQSGDRELADVLSHEAGVQTRKIGGFGAFSNLTVRAASGAQTGIYLDGILLNSGANGSIDLSTLDLLNLTSVDLYRGTAPLQLGHGNIGGAINLRTDIATGKPVSQLALGVGSFANQRLQLMHTARHDRWSVLAAFSHQASDNNFTFVNNNGTPLNPDDDRRESRHNAQAARDTLLARTGYVWSVDNRTDLVVQIGARDLGVPEWRNAQDNQANYDTKTEQYQLAQTLDGLGRWNTRHVLFLHRDLSHYDDHLSQVGLGTQDTRGKGLTRGFNSYWERLDKQGSLGISSELRHESLTTDDRIDRSRNFDAVRDQITTTVHYAWLDSKSRWTITPALRFQFIRDEVAENARLHNPGGTRRRDNNTGPQLGVLHQASNRLTLRMNVGSYYREPSFNELFGSIGLIKGNPTLIAEHGTNADIGFTMQASKTLDVNASLFVSWRDELIVTVFNAQGVGRAINSGEAVVAGIELSAKQKISDRFDIRGNLTWQHARSTNEASGFYGKQLPGEAQLSAFARLDYKASHWQAWLETEFEQGRYYDRANLLEAVDNTVHNLGIDWRNQQWRAGISVQNLTDDNIEDFNGYPRPGRSLFFSLSTHF